MRISSSDIKMETENEDGICQEDATAFLSQIVYHPRLALKNAIANWLPKIYQEKEADQQTATGCTDVSTDGIGKAFPSQLIHPFPPMHSGHVHHSNHSIGQHVHDADEHQHDDDDHREPDALWAISIQTGGQIIFLLFKCFFDTNLGNCMVLK
ncbi:uncharacterized protein LOC120426380 [Culex pipiens pallens]|uniref:uncharacterized protein LOC120426380 n=1 Tax=Culex pipiens pallens TaxID=42434 RepID=UPI0022AAE28E|nr:uncharacterized protein LOC120426380 [Culex pipiens pallens]